MRESDLMRVLKTLPSLTLRVELVIISESLTTLCFSLHLCVLSTSIFPWVFLSQSLTLCLCMYLYRSFSIFLCVSASLYLSLCLLVCLPLSFSLSLCVCVSLRHSLCLYLYLPRLLSVFFCISVVSCSLRLHFSVFVSTSRCGSPFICLSLSLSTSLPPNYVSFGFRLREDPKYSR